MNNNIAKNVTRQVVINLFNDYVTNSGQDEIIMASLPGKSFEFELAAANTCVARNIRPEMYCFEKNYHIYDHGDVFVRNFGFGPYSIKKRNEEVLYDTIEDCFYKNEDINDWSKRFNGLGPCFFWLDYCGCPKNGNTNYLKHIDYEGYTNPCVFVFTYEIAMRQGCDPEIQKHIDSGMSKAEAVIQYVKDNIKDTDFEVLFKIEYVSNRAPMILIAISNMKELKDNKYDYSHLEKVKKAKITISNGTTTADLIRADLKAGHADDVIMSKHNIGKRTLYAHKAWITMGK